MIDPKDDEASPHATSTQPSAPRTAPKSTAGHKPIEEWAKTKKVEPHWLAAAAAANGWARGGRVGKDWVPGREVTEQEFDAAIAAAKKVEMR